MADPRARPIASNARPRTAVDRTIASWSAHAGGIDVANATGRIAIAHDRAVVASGLAAWIGQRTTWSVVLLGRSDDARWDGVVRERVVVADEPSLARAGPDGTLHRAAWTRLVVMTDDREACVARHPATRIDAFIGADCTADALLDAVRPFVTGLHRPSTSNDDAVAWMEDLTMPAAAGHARTRGGGLAPHALQRVRQHVTAHLSERIQTDDLASLARLSSCHFTRAFRQSTGLPPHRYVLVRRIHAAAALVRDTERTFADIAASMGFSDQSHFTRTFARITGDTPRAFRRRHR